MNTFLKEERLSDIRLIAALYGKGSSFLCYPYKVNFLIFAFTEDRADQPAVKVLVSVPKKRFKRAVDRNLLKRRMREAYRLQKSQVLALALINEQKQLVFSLIFVGKEVLGFELMQSKMIKAIDLLIKAVNHA